ncbi:MAG: hypothetical protein HYR67_18190 [Bacteroidetes bacterium]|nr:hypothetical protein [Bacteroidota bacterium]
MNYTKEDVIREYKKFKEHLGTQPSSREFYCETGINRHVLENLFGSGPYSKLVKECGDSPVQFGTPKTELEDIFIQYGNFTRELGKPPFSADWKNKKGKPNISPIHRTHGILWSDMPYRFLEFAKDKPEWKDVVNLIPQQPSKSKSVENKKIENLSYEFYKFIPPVVQDLKNLSIDEQNATEFEKRTLLLFQLLGFEIDYYGQGTGRNPDGIVKATKERYVVLIDA